MARPKIPEQRKISEGKFLREKFKAAQEGNSGLSQDSLADALGISQGLIWQYFEGRTNVPDETLIKLGGMLGFNPYDVRSDLKGFLVFENIPEYRRKIILGHVLDLSTAEDEAFLKASGVLEVMLADAKEPPQEKDE